MIADMPRRLPTYVYREPSRHGRQRYYFRKGKGARIRLPDIDDPAFGPSYAAAVAGSPAAKAATKSAVGTLEWLIARYRETGHWLSLSAATRKQRECIYRQVIAKSGQVLIGQVDRAAVVRGRESRAATPAQARNFLDAMRGLFRWAHESGLMAEDPTAGVKNPRRQKGAGFRPWTEDDVAAYRGHWALGTKERVWLEVLLNTGLRRGDAVRLGRQHVRDGEATITTEKTGTDVLIPLTGDFLDAMASGGAGDMVFIAGDAGRPLTKESFGNMFRAACNAAGVKKSAHGLRKLAATRVAEAGASVAELESLFGWQGGAMASLYTKAADRKRLARRAGERLANANRPAPLRRRPAPSENK